MKSGLDLRYGLLFALLAMVVFTVFFVQCETAEKPCNYNETISGEILEVLDLGECYVKMDTTDYVITIDTVFYKLFEETDSVFLGDNSLYEYCDTLQLDTIDFSTYSLLGKYAEGTACDVAFQRDVQIDDRDKKYTYIISVHECGTCSLIEMSMNWVLVPAIPEDYTVEFFVDTTGTAIDSIYGQ